ALVAQAMGLPDYAALAVQLDASRQRVTRHFQDIFATAPDAAHPLAHVWLLSDDAARVAAEVERLGYRRPQAIAERLKTMHASGRYRGLPAASQGRLDR